MPEAPSPSHSCPAPTSANGSSSSWATTSTPATKFRQQPGDIDPATLANRISKKMRPKNSSSPSSFSSFIFPSSLLSNLVKIMFSMGLWLWYLAIKTATQVIVDLVMQYFEQQQQLQELQDHQQQVAKSTIPSVLANVVVNRLHHQGERNPHLYSHTSSSSSAQGTVKLRMRHSLRKRKEQILFGSPRSPSSPASPVSPRSPSSPSSPVSPASPASPASPMSTSPLSLSPEENGTLIYFQQMNGVAVRRVRTNSEIQEMDDQVMPLPNIKFRHKKWKSCGNVTSSSSASATGGGSSSSIFKPHQLRQQQQQQQMKVTTEPLVIVTNNHINEMESSRKKMVHFLDAMGRVRLRNPSADDVEVRKRRSLLLQRRQGRQLSDPNPSQHREMAAILLAQQLQQQQDQKQQQQQRKYLVVEHRSSSRSLEGLSLETIGSDRGAIRVFPPPVLITNGDAINAVNRGGEQAQPHQAAVVNVAGGGGGGRRNFLSTIETQQLKSAQRGP